MEPENEIGRFTTPLISSVNDVGTKQQHQQQRENTETSGGIRNLKPIWVTQMPRDKAGDNFDIPCTFTSSLTPGALIEYAMRLQFPSEPNLLFS
ncbi:hypothetical protein C5167_042914 [Papaver somniferum]|uniref:Uncharacterized protein n=1 Tax=Papaver somniferum TaxID=3469 RepID=A0A4Y7L7S3_PAPSO|nr:hypothetical protein C5167_042914 [Papaver somniferum]